MSLERVGMTLIMDHLAFDMTVSGGAEIRLSLIEVEMKGGLGGHMYY